VHEFLVTPLFKFIVYPLTGAVLGVFVKHVTRNDKYAKFKADDLAVGIDLLKTACLTFLVIISDKSAALIRSEAQLTEVLRETAHNPRLAPQATALHEANRILTSQVGNAGWIIALMVLGLWSLSTLVRKRGWNEDGSELKPGWGIALPLSIGALSLVLVMVKATS
jgi:hypothetical protein